MLRRLCWQLLHNATLLLEAQYIMNVLDFLENTYIIILSEAINWEVLYKACSSDSGYAAANGGA